MAFRNRGVCRGVFGPVGVFLSFGVLIDHYLTILAYMELEWHAHMGTVFIRFFHFVSGAAFLTRKMVRMVKMVKRNRMHSTRPL